MKKGVYRNFTKFTGKHLCQSLFFNKVATASVYDIIFRTYVLLDFELTAKILVNFIKKETLAQVFSCKFCEISKNNFCAEHLLATASVYDIIFRTYVLLDFELTTKISVNFPFFKNCKILVFKIIPCEFVPHIHIFLFNFKQY